MFRNSGGLPLYLEIIFNSYFIFGVLWSIFMCVVWWLLRFFVPVYCGFSFRSICLLLVFICMLLVIQACSLLLSCSLLLCLVTRRAVGAAAPFPVALDVIAGGVTSFTGLPSVLPNTSAMSISISVVLLAAACAACPT